MLVSLHEVVRSRIERFKKKRTIQQSLKDIEREVQHIIARHNTWANNSPLIIWLQREIRLSRAYLRNGNLSNAAQFQKDANKTRALIKRSLSPRQRRRAPRLQRTMH